MRAALAPAYLISSALLGACASSPELQAPSVVAVVAASEPAPTASAEPEPLPKGPPVLVSQRLPRVVEEVDLSPDGTLLAIAAEGGVRVIDVARGQTRGVLDGCADKAVFAPDSRSIVVTCGDVKRARIWDLASDKVHEMTLTIAPTNLALPPSGVRVAVCGEGAVNLIDTARGTVVALETGAPHEVSNAYVAPTGWVAALDREAATIFRPTGKLVRRIPRARNGTSYSLGSSGKLLALADLNDVVTYEVESGKEKLKVSPCPDGPVQDVEWTEDEQHLLIACGMRGSKPARVVLIAADGVEERELMQADRGGFFVRPRGERVAVGHPAMGVVVLEIATGRELYRLHPRSQWSHHPVLSRDLDRALFRNGRSLSEITVVDHAAGIVGSPLMPSSAPSRMLAAGDFLHFSYADQQMYFDPIKGVILRDPPGSLSPDGATFLDDREVPITSRLIHRRTGQRFDVPMPLGNTTPPVFSEHGRWLVIPETVSRGAQVVDYRLRLVDTKTGKDHKNFSGGGAVMDWAWNADDTLLAMRFPLGRSPTGKRCHLPLEYECAALRIFDVQSGRALATLQPREIERPFYTFTPDGQHILIGARVYDARTGRPSWSIPDGEKLRVLIPGRGMVISAGVRDHVVDPANGNTLRDIDPLGAVRAIAPGGGFLLSSHENELWLWRTDTWTRQSAKLSGNTGSRLALSPNGQLVYTVDGDDLVVHRLQDGRSLRRALPDLDADITDEGIFDPEQALSYKILVRRGPDVAKSPLSPLSFFEKERGHRRLWADFIVGKPVGPDAKP
ncbi:MAG: hypothetical protein QM820_53415 [Minicystis sp.]